MTEGWIKLHRRIIDNNLWTGEPFSRGQAWVDMILLANHKPGCVYVRGNKVPIKRGQIGWSIVKLSKRWTWSRNKVRRFLNDLENEQQIVQQKNTVTSIITIVKYNEYQSGDTTDDTANGTQTVHRRYTNKNVKNDKKEREGENQVEKSNQTDEQYPPSLELIKIPSSDREAVIAKQLKPLNLSKHQQDIYLSKIGASNYAIPRSGIMVGLTVESVFHDARHNLIQGYLESTKKSETPEQSIRNYMIA
jgi:hypothetical protein